MTDRGQGGQVNDDAVLQRKGLSLLGRDWKLLLRLRLCLRVPLLLFTLLCLSLGLSSSRLFFLRSWRVWHCSYALCLLVLAADCLGLLALQGMESADESCGSFPAWVSRKLWVTNFL